MKIAQIWMHAALLGFACAGPIHSAHGSDYADHPKASAFVEHMAAKHGFDKEQLRLTLNKAEKKQKILDAIARPAEKSKPWHEYRQIFLDDTRINLGVKFWNDNAETLAKVAQQYNVEPAIIVAIIGVETRYGSYMGSYRVLDALTTLGFDYPPRADFFAGQLEQFFLLAREQNQNPLELTGSYAGAMGYGQFIPSSYRHYARDFDGDGIADIWHNKQDAIASVANYFKAHGWQQGAPVTTKVKLSETISAAELNSIARPTTAVSVWQEKGVLVPEGVDTDAPAALMEYDQPQSKEYWLGFNNFYVITRYNRSRMYALAVWQLSEAIREAHENS